MPKKNTYTLHIPAQRKMLYDVRAFVEAHALLAGASLEVALQLVLATDEACTNIIMHGYNGDSKDAIEIRLTYSRKDIEIVLSHNGKPFELEHYHPPSGLRASVMARKKGGWGIFIMDKLMDSVQFKSKKGLNQVRLIKHL